MRVCEDRERMRVCEDRERMCVCEDRERMCVCEDRERMCVCEDRERMCVCEDRERMCRMMLLLYESWFLIITLHYFACNFLFIYVISSSFSYNSYNFFIFIFSDIAFGMVERTDRIFLKIGISSAVRTKQINGQCCVRTRRIRNYLHHDQVK
jgi:hypothetical protein